MTTAHPAMPRGWLWLQLAVAWLPMWALLTAIVVIVHHAPLSASAIVSTAMVVPGALLGIAVHRFASRTPWPHPFAIAFVGRHVLAAMGYAVSWYLAVSGVESIGMGRFVLGPGVGLFMLTGIWLYIVVAGVAYGNLAARRTAMLEAHAARMQLDALRAQLHPHFLFNALHAVVQLIPVDPRAAIGAAEQLAGALRTTIEERRDILSLAEEWAFVQRYLAIEGVRFGERLRLAVVLDDAALEMELPSFALQTLVENAVSHGASPRIETTTISIRASRQGDDLVLVVADDGAGASPDAIEQGNGTGLRRLRERMHWLYGDRARLAVETAAGRGFAATLSIPQFADASTPVERDGHDGR